MAATVGYDDVPVGARLPVLTLLVSRGSAATAQEG